MRAQLSRLAALLLFATCPAFAVVLTGEVRSDGAQLILTPPSMSSPVVLRFYVPDGVRVKQGDALLRIDAGTAAAQLRTLHDQIEQAQAKADKEVADLELKRVDAEIALNDADAARDTAAVDATIPKKLLSALDYDRDQGTAEGTRRDAELKRKLLNDARAAVTRRREDGALEVNKLQLQLGFQQAQVDTATVRAEHDGVVIHAFQTFSFGGGNGTGRYEEGSTAYPGNKVGEVVAAAGAYSVRAWALAPDRRGLKVGQSVRLGFDALPDHPAVGSIRRIANAPEAKPAWGDGHYYAIDIALDAAAEKLPLLPGMNVRVDTDTATTAAAAQRNDRALHADGEIYAQRVQAISPPEVQGLWQMNVTQMAADGAQVKKGAPIVTFAGGDLAQKLPTKQSELAEKQRTQEKLRLELADRARTTALATAQARADAEKAQRKATQPKDAVPGIDYKKLLIDRTRTQKRLQLTQERERVDALARTATQHLADIEAVQLKRQVGEMQKSLSTLTVMAPSAGIFVHRTDWNGNKIDTGSQVWRGVSVGEIPDMTSLAVRATLPERDLERVRVGQAVRILLNGGAGTLGGRIEDIGRSVHSKSRVEPVPVVDLRIAIDAGKQTLKPGQPVQVEFPNATKVATR